MTTPLFTLLKTCRICHSEKLQDVIHLGEQDITSRFPVYGDYSTPKTPIDLCLCGHCGLLQLRQTTNSTEMYEHEYGYRSGINNTMRGHLKSYQAEILSKVVLNPGDVIVDIGSNDSTMLQYYSSDLKRIGIDPTGKQFKEFYGDVELVENYFTSANFQAVYGDVVRCKVVSSISMFYDLPDPVQFARDIYDILEDDGIWTCEQSYLVTMLERKSFDTICHEHLEYYALHQIKEIADRAHFKIIDVKFNECNGGSFRIYFAKQDSSRYSECADLIAEILRVENAYGVRDPETYMRFMRDCDAEMKKLCDFVDAINANGKEIWLYGASTKGNCLLQYANIGENRIKYAVERNLKKVGKMTSSGIPIISEETMRKSPPAYLLVLPWHFRDEIITREKEFLDGGGQIVFPLPELEIVSAKPKVLVTGCDGHLAHYYREEYGKTYTLYGIGHANESYQSDILKFYIDMTDEVALEHVLTIIRPDTIIHLASISSSIKAFHNPITTIKTNGLVAAQIGDIIHRHAWKTRMFHASSSEIYKGHVQYKVGEDDTHMSHLHPYSIAKIMGHTMMDFYRNVHGLPFSNGVIFTTESPYKSKDFLLNKVADHATRWKQEMKPLYLGNLDSYRNMLHAKDVVRAIDIIMQQAVGADYLICGDSSVKIFDLVVEIYAKNGIHLMKDGQTLYDIDTSAPVVVIGKNMRETDTTIINIDGEAKKLRELGWAPEFSIHDILLDITKGH